MILISGMSHKKNMMLAGLDRRLLEVVDEDPFEGEAFFKFLIKDGKRTDI